MKQVVPILFILTACNVGTSEVQETSNTVLHCESYGDIVTTTQLEQEEVEETPVVDEQPIIEEAPAIQEDTGVNLVPGLRVKSVSYEHAELCELKGLCKVLQMDSDKAVVEHCANLYFVEE